MALTDNKNRKVRRPDLAVKRTFYVAASETIYVGAIVSVNASGYLAKAAGTARVAGIACEYLANGAATSTVTIPAEIGQIEEFTFAGAAKSDIGKKVYATADDTLTFTANTSLVGEVIDYLGNNIVSVRVTGGA